jgi:hypothetical protein
MSTLDPAVRDLLVAARDTLDAEEHPTSPTFAVQAVLGGLVRGGGSTTERTEYLREAFGEAADANRVRFADRIALYQASKDGAA